MWYLIIKRGGVLIPIALHTRAFSQFGVQASQFFPIWEHDQIDIPMYRAWSNVADSDRQPITNIIEVLGKWVWTESNPGTEFGILFSTPIQSFALGCDIIAVLCDQSLQA